MKKKSQKFANFILSANVVNYRENAVIIDHFNDSVSLFKRFQDINDAGDEQLASEKLRNAGTYLYQTCEWALKNYLHKRYMELETEGTYSLKQRTQKIDELSRKDATLFYLIKEFKNISEPSFKTRGINFNNILGNAQLTNNSPKHNATIPDPNQYIKSLGEVRKIIKNYIDADAQLDLLDDSIYGEGNAWYEVLEYTSDFSEAFSYVLVVNPVVNINVKGLFSFKWDLILDLDPATDVYGLEKKYLDYTGVTPWVRMLDKIDSKKKFSMSRLPYWIMGNGSIDNPDSIAEENKWKNKYGKYLNGILEEFHKVYTKPVKVFVYPMANERNLERIVESFNDIYDEGEKVDFYVLSSQQEYSRIDSDNFRISSLTFEEFCNKLEVFNENDDFILNAMNHKLPGEEGKIFDITEAFNMELQDSFEVVYINIDKTEEDDAIKTVKSYFYRGDCDVSWCGLRDGFDVIRKDQVSIIEKINKDMQDRGRYLKRICYEPGVGGTTLMRRLAWELRVKYPTLIMKKYNEQSARNIQKLYDITYGQILIFVDSNNIEIEEVKNLQFELKKMGFAFLICYVERKLKGIPISDAAIYTVVKLFDTSEAIEMKSRLIEYTDDKEILMKLDNIVEEKGSDERTPFIMSMYTFDKEFKGIKPYISNYLIRMNEYLKKIVFALALADYGNVSIDIQYFADLFEDESIDNFIIDKMPGINELVRIENINGKNNLRIRYHLFAEEILKQMSLGRDATTISFFNLVDLILNFIEDSRKNLFNINQDTLHLLRTLFITRSADVDAEKPAFSPLITKLIEEHRVSDNGQYSGENDVIVRIFNKLVEVYPEEAHFTAHLARYYFYIDRNFEKGFKNIDYAIELSETMYGYVDPLLYHMKAMGYSSKICNAYIYQIMKNCREGNEEENNSLKLQIEEDANIAFDLFKKVRESNVGIAGHVSEINLCIRISKMARDILDETENFEQYLLSDDGKWVIKYIDKATCLWEEARKIAPETNDNSLEEIETKIRELSASINETISLWENYLQKCNDRNKLQVRRLLANAYGKQATNNISYEEKQKCYSRIIQLMEDNMMEEGEHSGNIRIWFETIRKYDTSNQESLMMDAMIKLNKWIALTDSVEAHYYRFVLKFIQTINGSALAESELSKLLRELKAKSISLYNRTATQHWIMNEGEGLGRLMNNSRNKKDALSEDEMAKKMLILVGRISNNYVNDSHAYIRYRGVEVYFNPSATKGEIDKTKINQRVRFGVGFSYDGPRAFNSSIKLLGKDDYEEEEKKIEHGLIVKCEVIKNVAYFIQVRIIGYDNCFGSIHISELVDPYSDNNRPKNGMIFDAKVLNEKFNNRLQRNVWMLTMDTTNSREHMEQYETEMEKALKKLNLKLN